MHRSVRHRLALLVLGSLLAAGCAAGASPSPSPRADAGPTTPPATQIVPSPAVSSPTSSLASPIDEASGLPWIDVAALPPEAVDMLELIRDDGPFPYPQDGRTFENREGILPPHPEGYYHEYTVITPGSDDRGARRLVTGAVDETYYTDDHYESFSRVRRP